MLKLIPNHSSKTNLMFERSILKEIQYKDYYIWNPGYSVGVNHYPINNWVSIHYVYSIIEYRTQYINCSLLSLRQLNVSGDSAWEWNNMRKEFYLHKFSEDEPDFNFRNKNVVDYFEVLFIFIINCI